MGRTEVLQEIRMLRFEEIYDRFGGGRLSAVEAAEWLGVSERTFRRQRVRFEEAGLAGLLDRRLGKPSRTGFRSTRRRGFWRCTAHAMSAGR
jgi:hypothetical protein